MKKKKGKKKRREKENITGRGDAEIRGGWGGG